MSGDANATLKEKNSSLLTKSIEINTRDVELDSDIASNTWNDLKDMERLGRKQEMKVRDSYLGMVISYLIKFAHEAYVQLPNDSRFHMSLDEHLGRSTDVSFTVQHSCITQALTTKNRVSSFGLVNGGTAGLIYMYITTWFGFSCLIASMAEMASMAPTTGGQYHWVSEFSPKSTQRFLSYITGTLIIFISTLIDFVELMKRLF